MDAIPASSAAAAFAEVRPYLEPSVRAAVQAGVEAFIVEQYAAHRSLGMLTERTDRSFSAARNILTQHGAHHRDCESESVREPVA